MKNQSESKFLAFVDQSASSTISLIAFLACATELELRQVAMISLASNVSYSIATLLKTRYLYPILIQNNLGDEDRLSPAGNLTVSIPPFWLITLISSIVFGVAFTSKCGLEFSLLMIFFSFGTILTDYCRNGLIQVGLRSISFYLNCFSLFILIVSIFIEILNNNSEYSILTAWSIIQFIFPSYTFFFKFLHGVRLVRQGQSEVENGRIFLYDTLILRAGSILTSIALLKIDPNLAGLLSIAYLLYAAFPSLVTSAFQPIANVYMTKSANVKKLQNIILWVYFCHLASLILVFVLVHNLDGLIPQNFSEASSWGIPIVCISLLTSLLNLHQIEMFKRMNSTDFLFVRFLLMLLIGPFAILMLIVLGKIWYSSFSIVLAVLVNPMFLRKISGTKFSQRSHRDEENKG